MKVAPLLDMASPYAGQAEPIVEETMFGAAPTPAFDGRQDAKLRVVGMQDRAQTYPLKELNQELLIEMGTIMGRPFDQTQNPYVWAASGVLEYDVDGKNSKLIPSYGITGDTADDVALNAQLTAGILQV